MVFLIELGLWGCYAAAEISSSKNYVQRLRTFTLNKINHTSFGLALSRQNFQRNKFSVTSWIWLVKCHHLDLISGLLKHFLRS